MTSPSPSSPAVPPATKVVPAAWREWLADANERQVVLGALGLLASALEAHGPRWTEGEHHAHAAAVRILRRRRGAPPA